MSVELAPNVEYDVMAREWRGFSVHSFPPVMFGMAYILNNTFLMQPDLMASERLVCSESSPRWFLSCFIVYSACCEDVAQGALGRVRM
eukprot:1066413-Amphidinium_carterae.1